LQKKTIAISNINLLQQIEKLFGLEKKFLTYFFWETKGPLPSSQIPPLLVKQNNKQTPGL
jgi:hypothetical protein